MIDPLATIGREAQDFARSFVSQAKQDLGTVKNMVDVGNQKVIFFLTLTSASR